MSTAKSLDARLEGLVHEIREIKKELIRSRMTRGIVSRTKDVAWISLGKKVSTRWDEVSAVDEISAQREKVW